MRIAFLASAFLLLCPVVSPARAQDFRTAIIKARNDILAFYPSEALSKGLDGTATLTCRSSPHGAARDCVLNSESPAGAGFGPAAMKIAALSVEYPGLDLTLDQQAEPRGITFIFRATPASIEPNPLSPFRVIRHPQYSSLAGSPSPVYPDRAARKNLGGAVVLHCRLDGAGAVGGCAIDSETPEGYGFGIAAEKVASFRTVMGDHDSLGLPKEGAFVIQQFVFRPPPH